MDPTLDEFLFRPNVDPSPAISISFTHAVFIVLRRMPSFNGRTRSGRPVSSSSSTLVTCLSNHSLSENSFHSRDPKRSENSNDLSNHLVARKSKIYDHFATISISSRIIKANRIPLLQRIMPRFPKTSTTNVDYARRTKRERERERFLEEDALRAVIVHWLLGDTLECRRISSLPWEEIPWVHRRKAFQPTCSKPPTFLLLPVSA